MMNNYENYEKAIAKTGWGLCHYLLVGMCGLLSLAEASTSLTLPVVAPLLACDFKLNKDQATMPVASSSFGMAIGAFLFGSISDIVGRRKLLPITMGIVFCASTSLSFTQTNFLINLSIFMLGLGVAGNNTVLKVYLIEFLPIRKRGICLAVIDMFWVVGYLSTLGISWSLMPSIVDVLGKQFRPISWRVVAILYGTPSLAVASASSLLPPSPRYLLYRRRSNHALTVLRQFYAINNSKHVDAYPLDNLESCIRPDVETEEISRIKNIRKYFIKTCERIRRIYKSPYKLTTLCGILACLLQFPGFAWLALWNTHVLQETKRSIVDGNETCYVNFQDISLNMLRSCDEINETSFEILLLISLGYIVGEALLIIGTDLVSRKLYLISFGLAGGVASLMLIFPTVHTTHMILSSIFLAAHAIGRTTTCVLLLENYPTALRGTVMGLTKILPHLMLFAMQSVARTSCRVTLMIASITLMGATFVMLPVPDLFRLPMKE